MGHGKAARGRGAGREGLRATRPVSDPPHDGAHLGSGSRDDVMASAKSTRVWGSGLPAVRPRLGNDSSVRQE